MPPHLATRLWDMLRRPILAPMLRSRGLLAAFAGFAAFHAGMAWMKWNPLPCPLLSGAGVPCPGCGLSRSVAASLRGDLATALHYHAFGPLGALALAGIVLALLLPGAVRLRLAQLIDAAERRTAFASLLVTGLVLYWLIRIVYLQDTYVRLMRG